MRLRFVFTLLVFVTTVDSAFAANREQVLYSFCSSNSTCADGAFPYSRVVVDARGNIYGTTYGGGNAGCNFAGCGTVFQLSPDAARSDGPWIETVLHTFASFVGDGANPQGGVIFDHQGNLYGTAFVGGLGNAETCNFLGCGVVFELTPSGNGTWTEQILYQFCSASNCSDGANPSASLVFDAAGNLYGTTRGGGFYGSHVCKSTEGCGTVFKLSKGSNGIWTETVLYEFNFTDGAYPLADVVLDASGNVYGTTSEGGTYGYGNVFELTPTSKGFWNAKALHDFDSTDGRSPFAPLTLDSSGNLYGTTYQGGNSNNGGVAFELSSGANGWTEQVLHSFCSENNCADGGALFDRLVPHGGNFYGTTYGGGILAGDGTVFELTPAGNDVWNHAVLYEFGGEYTDGLNPQATVTFGPSGTVLYGTTANGGSSTNCTTNNGSGCGTVYALTR
jgi:uncharacterized repeat protein (TIGR03803 family)